MHAHRPAESSARNDAAQMVVSCDCRAQYRVKRAHAGKAFRCKRCNVWITVPSLATSLIAPPDDDEVELELVETRLMQDLNDDPKTSRALSTSADPADSLPPPKQSRRAASGFAPDGTYELADAPPSPPSRASAESQSTGLDTDSSEAEGDEHELLAGLSRAAAGQSDGVASATTAGRSRRAGGRSSKANIWVRSLFIAVLVGTVALALHQAITSVVTSQGETAQAVRAVDRPVLEALQQELSGWSRVYLDEELTIGRLDWLISSSTEGGKVVPFSGTIIDATSSRVGSLSGRLDFRTGHIEAEWQVDDFRNQIRMRLDGIAGPTQRPGDS